MSGISAGLLAKSGPPTIYLDEHTQDVDEALVGIIEIWPELPKTLHISARFHDFGKAADGFQKMLRQGTPWAYRHEVLSAAVFLQCFEIDGPDMRRAYLALLSHHKNLLDSDERVSQDFRHCQSTTSSGAVHWRKKWNELNIPALRSLFAVDLANWKLNLNVTSPADKVGEYADEILPALEDVKTALCRGALVAADHLASAKMGQALFGKNITRMALYRYARKNIENWRRWNAMQKACRIKGSAILTAPTGSGKTEAALLWCLRNRRQYERIFYVLPYQVSINAMAERLSKVFPDDNGNTKLHKNATVSALHSNTALAYLRSAMNDNMPLDRAIPVAEQAGDAARKIYAPIKVTTIYQLLDIFFGRKFFEVGLLELTNSLVVFDEIHAYDGHTLGLALVLLECLHRLGAHVFIMTATLPPVLRERLQTAAHISPDNIIALKPNDELLIEERRAVYLHQLTIESLAEGIVRAIGSKKRVVVVCNTVDKAICMFEKLSSLSPMLIHSRFTIGDRAKRETKDNLSSEDIRFIISTQVIEVSLDVSFDVMFTELAPIDDLLQRFGRVNRHGEPTAANLGICHVALGVDIGSTKVYGEALLEATRRVMVEDIDTTVTDAVKTHPLDYHRACNWIERVYPDGLPEDQRKLMEDRCDQFKRCVNSLRPMVDATDTELEKNLFQSVQVVPAKYGQEWYELKKQRRHMEAKMLIVSVDARVWAGCCGKHGAAAKHVIPYGTGTYQREQIVALFDYRLDTDGKFNGTGLRLDKDPVPNPMTRGCILSDDDD